MDGAVQMRMVTTGTGTGREDIWSREEFLGADKRVREEFSGADKRVRQELPVARIEQDFEGAPASGVERARTRRETIAGALEVATTPDIVLNGVSLELSRLHSRILAALLESAEPLPTARIAEIVWQGRFVAEHTVHSQIALLRARVLDFGLRIRSVRGKGYVLE